MEIMKRTGIWWTSISTILRFPVPRKMISPLPFNLGENFPNPFSEQTYIPYQIRKAGQVLIEVYNEQGRRVDILVNGRMMRGNHLVAWNSSTHPAGIYLCRMHFDGMHHSGKMLLVR